MARTPSGYFARRLKVCPVKRRPIEKPALMGRVFLWGCNCVQLCSAFHISMSRSAVQMRGFLMPLASS
jgi:hypothetical protein